MALRCSLPRLFRANATLLKRWNRPEKTMHIVPGDVVEVIDPTHKDYGQQGEVVERNIERNMVLIKGLNMGYKHVRPTVAPKAISPFATIAEGKGNFGGKILRLPLKMDAGRVKLVDPATKEPTDVSYRWLEDGTRVRVSSATGNILGYPEQWLRKDLPNEEAGESELTTPADIAIKQTYVPEEYSLDREPTDPIHIPHPKRG
eukprot:Rmarinus@m.7598